jgi:CheY-like chemotaxis protein
MTDIRSLKVLLADDRSEHRQLILKMLQTWGFEVDCVASQKEAIKAIRAKRFDLAIVDMTMEYGDSGFVIAYHIKIQNPDTHVILLGEVTSDIDFHFETTSASERSWLKADAILDKPLRPDQLQAEINHIFHESLIADVAVH